MNLKVSLITICLNNEGVIRATTQSIFDQSYKNVERIVIDGGSTDGTIEYLESVKDKLTVLISESDKGIYDAYNKGAKVATGDYIMFMNAGDRLRGPDVIEDVMTDPEVIASRPKIISGRWQLEYNGKLLNLFRPAKAGKDGPGLPHEATFVDANLQKENLFDVRYRVASDYELWQRLKSKGLHDVKYIDNVISVFSLGGVSTSLRKGMGPYLERTFINYLYTGRFGLVDWVALFFKPALRNMMYLLGLRERTYFGIRQFMKR